ncbi:hypothetical protein BD770DRAFT_293681, partial [Pilaira anomala]
MEVDATTTEKKFKPLSNKEKQKRRDEGLCLYCGSSGHLLDSCPKKSVKKILDTFDAEEHIVIDVVLKIKDKTIHTVAMLDSGAMSNFIDIEFCLNNQLRMDKKNNSIEILTVDGSPISSGRVTH